MKKHLLLVILLFYCFSCVSHREIITKSIIKLEGKNTNIRNLIEIDGYYHVQDYPNSSHSVFFEDGTYVSFYFKRDIPENEIKANMSKSVNSWIEDKQIRWGNYWGVYKIERDTLIIYYYINKIRFWQVGYLDEIRYKVKDRTTIIPIYSKGLLNEDERYYKNNNISPCIKNRKEISFSPADSLPSSDCWLKEEKWIWRNESDWKAYMKKVKQIKKQYKKK